jgi:hypothetical protein
MGAHHRQRGGRPRSPSDNASIRRSVGIALTYEKTRVAVLVVLLGATLLISGAIFGVLEAVTRLTVLLLFGTAIINGRTAAKQSKTADIQRATAQLQNQAGSESPDLLLDSRTLKELVAAAYTAGIEDAQAQFGEIPTVHPTNVDQLRPSEASDSETAQA